MRGRGIVLAVGALAIAGCATRTASLSTRNSAATSSTTVRHVATSSAPSTTATSSSSTSTTVGHAQAQTATAPLDGPATTVEPVTTTEPSIIEQPTTTTTAADPAPWTVTCSTYWVRVDGGDPGVLYDVVVPWAQDPMGIRQPLTTTIPAGQAWEFNIPRGGPGTISVTSRETGETQTCQP